MRNISNKDEVIDRIAKMRTQNSVKLAAIRKYLGLSLNQASVLLDLNVTTIRDIEQNKIKITDSYFLELANRYKSWG